MEGERENLLYGPNRRNSFGQNKCIQKKKKNVKPLCS